MAHACNLSSGERPRQADPWGSCASQVGLISEFQVREKERPYLSNYGQCLWNDTRGCPETPYPSKHCHPTHHHPILLLPPSTTQTKIFLDSSNLLLPCSFSLAAPSLLVCSPHHWRDGRVCPHSSLPPRTCCLLHVGLGASQLTGCVNEGALDLARCPSHFHPG